MNRRSVAAHETDRHDRSGSPATGERYSGNLPRVVDSQTLLEPHDVLHIRHAGEIYRLRLTRLGKLILTK